MNNWREPKTKPEAVAFVSAVMRHDPALLSPDFKKAIEISSQFQITAGDLLEYRREKVRAAARTHAGRA